MDKRILLAAAVVLAIVIVILIDRKKPAGCTSSAGCLPGQVCQAGKCVMMPPPGCRSDAECAAGQKCQAGVCVTPAPVKPRWSNIADCGYGTQLHGWFDAQGQGVKNDYCRFVGDEPGWFACALAGSTNPYTPKGQFDPAKLLAAGCDASPGASCGGGGCTLPYQ